MAKIEEFKGTKKINQKIPEIYKILEREALLSEDLDRKILEGKIFICKNQTNNSYIERWAELSKRNFVYYRNRLANIKENSKPIFNIPLIEIQKISRIENSNSKSEKKQTCKYPAFQLFIKNNDSILDAEFSTIIVKSRRNTINHQISISPNMQEMSKKSYKTNAEFDKMSENSSYTSPSQCGKHKSAEKSNKKLFIFAVENEAELHKWIIAFEWIIKLYE